MELIRQLWITSAPFRILTCVTAVSLVLAITTADIPNADETPASVAADEGGLLDTIKQHLPGQEPKSPIDKATSTAKAGVELGKHTVDTAIETTGELADQVFDGIAK